MPSDASKGRYEIRGVRFHKSESKISNAAAFVKDQMTNTQMQLEGGLHAHEHRGRLLSFEGEVSGQRHTTETKGTVMTSVEEVEDLDQKDR
ncbi:hypothetical protein RB195_012651 [Necator americanus]|uniref:Uncharacterized protein n=1 Tax=Necator americanus TaxID=51031 RepID=A0ABR1DTD7_NECAM